MNKSLNQQIFEILDRQFPGEFSLIPGGMLKGYISYKGDEVYSRFKTRDFERIDDPYTLRDVFWVAEELGLFDSHVLTSLNLTKKPWLIMEKDFYNEEKDSVELIKEIASAPTIPEVICKAIIEVYGENLQK